MVGFEFFAVFQPAQGGVGGPTGRTFELHCLGRGHGMQFLFHLLWGRPVWSYGCPGKAKRDQMVEVVRLQNEAQAGWRCPALCLHLHARPSLQSTGSGVPEPHGPSASRLPPESLAPSSQAHSSKVGKCLTHTVWFGVVCLLLLGRGIIIVIIILRGGERIYREEKGH